MKLKTKQYFMCSRAMLTRLAKKSVDDGKPFIGVCSICDKPGKGYSGIFSYCARLDCKPQGWITP